MKISKEDQKLLNQLLKKYNLTAKKNTKFDKTVKQYEKQAKRSGINNRKANREVNKLKKDFVNFNKHNAKSKLYQADIHIMGFKPLKSGVLKEYVTDDRIFKSIQSNAFNVFHKSGDYSIASNQYIRFMNTLNKLTNIDNKHLYNNLKHIESAMSQKRVINLHPVKKMTRTQSIGNRLLIWLYMCIHTCICMYKLFLCAAIAVIIFNM